MSRPAQTETQEARKLADWLTLFGIVFVHVPNETVKKGRERRDFARYNALVAEGFKPGFPDYMVLSPPPCGFVVAYRIPGVAIELKRPKAPPSAFTAAQRAWKMDLEAIGWLHFVGDADGAIEFLGDIGYGRQA